MKRTVKLFTLLTIGFSVTFCSKKKDAPVPFNNTNGNVQNEFSWSENGGAIISADSVFGTSGAWGTGIRAYKGGYLNFFELNLDNADTGDHVLSSSSAFLKGNDTYPIASGILNVRANGTRSAFRKL